jgi:hypothetical protein
MAAAQPAVADDSESPPVVTVERVVGAPLTGPLLAVEGGVVRIDAAGGVEAVPVDAIRRLDRGPHDATRGEGVGVTLTDGSRLTGDRFTWDGDGAALFSGEGRATLPRDQVRLVEWPAAAAEAVTPWSDLIPEPLDSDVVVVGTPGSFECVACAIAAVGGDTVTVLLDGETIPVRRDKVAGVRWLRDEGRTGPISVTTTVGRLTATSITWTPAALVLDDTVRMPADWLRAIDYATGRTVSLAALSPERVEIEPFFAGLADVQGFDAFFAPRPVGDDVRSGAPAGIVVRPRTRAVWRVPADARRFRAVVLPAARAVGEMATDAGVVSIVIDGTTVLREAVVYRGGDEAGHPEARPISVELTAARRLEILVDFPEAGGMGGAVLVGTPVFDK